MLLLVRAHRGVQLTIEAVTKQGRSTVFTKSVFEMIIPND